MCIKMHCTVFAFVLILYIVVILQSFLMRKFYFNNQEDGFFKKTKRKVVPPSPMTGKNSLLFYSIIQITPDLDENVLIIVTLLRNNNISTFLCRSQYAN